MNFVNCCDIPGPEVQLSFKTEFYVSFQEAKAAKHKVEIKQAALQMALIHVNSRSYMETISRHPNDEGTHRPPNHHTTRSLVKRWDSSNTK